MLDRNKRIKEKPERFQENQDEFDLILTCQERVFDQVLESKWTATAEFRMLLILVPFITCDERVCELYVAKKLRELTETWTQIWVREVGTPVKWYTLSTLKSKIITMMPLSELLSFTSWLKRFEICKSWNYCEQFLRSVEVLYHWSYIYDYYYLVLKLFGLCKKLKHSIQCTICVTVSN